MFVFQVGSLRQVTTKQEGKQLDNREVELMDQSPTPLFLQLWDTEMAYRADNWKPRETSESWPNKSLQNRLITHLV